MKVSYPGFQSSLEREKSVYDELEILQGSAIPRCYGLFQATLPQGSELIGWDTFEIDDSDSEDTDSDPDTSTVSILLLEELDGPLSADHVGKPFPEDVR